MPPLARTAAAEEPPAPAGAPQSQALALFHEGRALMESHDYAAAAAKFEESFRLDPGGGTKLNLALAYELAGKTGSAWASFQDALQMAKRDARADRVEEAEGHLRKLEPRLSRLRVVVPAASRAPGLEVLRDGAALGDGSWGIEVVVDPGPHRIEARAPGRRPWLAEVTVNDFGDRKEITLSALEDLPRAPERSRLRSIAWISLGAGGLGLATAAATATVALAQRCSGGNCGPGTEGRVGTYTSLRTVSTISFWAGAGLAATGLGLFLLSPAKQEDRTTVVVAPRFAGLAGRF